jgi:hypothetical protein
VPKQGRLVNKTREQKSHATVPLRDCPANSQRGVTVLLVVLSCHCCLPEFLASRGYFDMKLPIDFVHYYNFIACYRLLSSVNDTRVTQQ